MAQSTKPPAKTRKLTACPRSLAAQLAQKIVGQPDAIQAILPFVEMFQAGLAPEGRPAGVFLLLGPTGTGKTRTVEALAEVLHGSHRNVVRVDCGEFQMEHEVAKLIGAPPGYLGHRETPPMLSQQRLTAATTPDCGLSIVLFDEIEKAAASLSRLLLGVLDKATLRLGDNTTVDFSRSLVFFTSNLGAQEMARSLQPGFGFAKGTELPGTTQPGLESIALRAVRRKFSPEFVNRIDASVTYHPLTKGALEQILDLQIEDLQKHINRRLGPACFTIAVSPAGRKLAIERGVSLVYGARELKRTLHRHLLQPVAAMLTRGAVRPGARVTLDARPGDNGQDDFRIEVAAMAMGTRSKREAA